MVLGLGALIGAGASKLGGLLGSKAGLGLLPAGASSSGS